MTNPLFCHSICLVSSISQYKIEQRIKKGKKALTIWSKRVGALRSFCKQQLSLFTSAEANPEGLWEIGFYCGIRPVSMMSQQFGTTLLSLLPSSFRPSPFLSGYQRGSYQWGIAKHDDYKQNPTACSHALNFLSVSPHSKQLQNSV